MAFGMTVAITPPETYKELNPADFDGTVTYGFEVEGRNPSGTSAAIALVDSTGTIYQTISIAGGTTGEQGLDVFSQRVAFTPAVGSTRYGVKLPFNAGLFITVARIVVSPSGSTKGVSRVPLFGATDRPVFSGGRWQGPGCGSLVTGHLFGSSSSYIVKDIPPYPVPAGALLPAKPWPGRIDEVYNAAAYTNQWGTTEFGIFRCEDYLTIWKFLTSELATVSGVTFSVMAGSYPVPIKNSQAATYTLLNGFSTTPTITAATAGIYTDAAHTNLVAGTLIDLLALGNGGYWLQAVALTNGNTYYQGIHIVRGASETWSVDTGTVASGENYWRGFRRDNVQFTVVSDIAQNIYYRDTWYAALGKTVTSLGLYYYNGSTYTLVPGSLVSASSWSVTLTASDFTSAGFPGAPYYLGVQFSGEPAILYLPYFSIQAPIVNPVHWVGSMNSGGYGWEVFLDADSEVSPAWADWHYTQKDLFVALWDKTANAIVAGSEIAFPGTETLGTHRGTPIQRKSASVAPGAIVSTHEYEVRCKTAQTHTSGSPYVSDWDLPDVPELVDAELILAVNPISAFTSWQRVSRNNALYYGGIPDTWQQTPGRFYGSIGVASRVRARLPSGVTSAYEITAYFNPGEDIDSSFWRIALWNGGANDNGPNPGPEVPSSSMAWVSGEADSIRRRKRTAALSLTDGNRYVDFQPDNGYYLIPNNGFLLLTVVGSGAPGECVSVSAILDGTLVTGTGTGVGTAWRVLRTSDSAVMDSGSGASAAFSFSGALDVQYQLQFLGTNGSWSTSGCTFTFTGAILTCPPDGTIEAVCKTGVIVAVCGPSGIIEKVAKTGTIVPCIPS